MIRCLCPSPSVDVTYQVERLLRGATTRVRAVTRRAGGKAVNVARVVHSAGSGALVVAAVGGPAGTEFAADLAAEGIEHSLVPAAPTTRCTVTVVEDDGSASVLTEHASLGAGWPRLAALAVEALTARDVLVVSGSMPNDVAPDALTALVADGRGTGSSVVVDTSGPPLLAALAAAPTLVAPNRDELAEVTGDGDPERAATALARRFDTVVVASLGPVGVLAATPERVWTARPPEQLTGNPTGAGDALVAGIALHLAGDAVRDDPAGWLPAALREGVALSAAAVLVPYAGAVDVDYAARVRPLVEVDQLEPAR
ncbi:1-phosphofructokinase family hexose kinase [uncultured Jatrophihabitans sp.]|uniref:1-phosphofructokinase family hexose kinase n=1 Tax=uncultured Jatrophihabitans sp. TaxID=1610747 RepID=UPI0035CA3522